MKKLLAAGLGLVVLGACSGSPSRPSPSTSGPVETATPAPVTTLEDLVPGLDGTETAPPASPLAAAKPLTLAVAGTAGTGAWQASTVGLSFESSDLADPRWEPENSDLALLLDALGHPSLRFGGNSADRRVWWTSSNEPAPTWATVTVTPADLQRVARMAHTTRSTVTLVLDLGHHDPARAADMAAHARKAFGKSLLAVTIGNEPNGFALASQPQLKLRPATWCVADYIAQATTYAQKIHATTPGLPIAGPGAYDAPWWRAFAESGITPKAALTQHWYPLWSCAGRTDGDPLSSPTVANLLSARTHQRAVTTMTMAKQVAATHDLPLWMEETGPTSCSGSAISGTPAQALWSIDYLLTAARLGVGRVNMHSTLLACGMGNPMSTVCGTDRTPTSQLRGRDGYLGLLFASQTGTGTVREIQTGDPAVRGYQVATSTGVDVVLINTADPSTSGAHPIIWKAGTSLSLDEASWLASPTPGTRDTTRMAMLHPSPLDEVDSLPAGSAMLVRFSSETTATKAPPGSTMP